jgi:hypothetical protein
LLARHKAAKHWVFTKTTKIAAHLGKSIHRFSPLRQQIMNPTSLFGCVQRTTRLNRRQTGLDAVIECS